MMARLIHRAVESMCALCVFGVGDLSWMLRKHHFFANKFDMDVDPFALQCLEEHLRHKALETLER